MTKALTYMLVLIGNGQYDIAFDLNFDGLVTIQDLLILLQGVAGPGV